MNGDEFIRKLRKLAKAEGVDFEVVTKKGKGSHKTVYYGDEKTTVKHGEIKKGLLKGMCNQIGIDKEDL